MYVTGINVRVFADAQGYHWHCEDASPEICGPSYTTSLAACKDAIDEAIMNGYETIVLSGSATGQARTLGCGHILVYIRQ